MRINNIFFNEKIKFRREPFGGLVYHPEWGYTIEVNRTAQLLLELSSIGTPVNKIIKILSDLFKTDLIIVKKDIQNIVRQFVNYKILIENGTEKKLDFGDPDAILEKPWPDHLVKNSLNVPEVIHLAVTENCPLNCPGCYVDAGSPLAKELTTSEIFKFIDIMHENNIFQLGLGGGEAMVRRDILDIISYAIEKELTVALTSSGVNITKDMALKLKEVGVKQIQISHDGFSQAVFEQTRSKGSYKIAKNAIKNLKLAGIDFGFNVLVTPNVLKELPQLIAYAESEGAVEIILLRPKPSGRDDQKGWFEKNKLTWDHQIYLINMLKNLNTNLRIRTDTSFSMLYYNINPDYLYQKGVFGCTAARRFCSINSDGSIFPCSHFFQYPEFNGGSCLHLIENWQHSKAFESFRDFEEQIEEPCFSCENLKVCKGCRKVALLETNSFFGIDKYCLKNNNKLGGKSNGY